MSTASEGRQRPAEEPETVRPDRPEGQEPPTSEAFSGGPGGRPPEHEGAAAPESEDSPPSEPSESPQSSGSPQSSEPPEPQPPADGGGTSTPDDPPELAPIPEEGTAAPSDAGRVFGQGDATPSGIPAEPPRPGAPQPTGTDPGNRAPAALTEEDQQRLRSRGRLALIFALAGAFIAILFLPTGTIIGLLLAIVGLVLGVLTWRAGRRARVRVPGTTPAIVIGGLALTVVLCLGVVTAVYWQEFSRAADCMSGANTQTAREDCVKEFTQQMERRGVKIPESAV